MLQIATFDLTAEVKEANDFLSHVHVKNLNYFPDSIVVTFDDGEQSIADKIANWQGLYEAAEAAKDQQEIALHMLQYERADLNPKHNKGRYEELSAGIDGCTRAISMQEEKMAFCLKKIEAIRSEK